MENHRGARRTLLVTQAFVAVTALIGGLALVLGSVDPTFAMAITPPAEYLDGSWFDSYAAPGLVLAGVVGGLQALAFVFLLRARPLATFMSAMAAYAILVWIFVQMVLIPFSWLQAVYFAAGAFELGLVLLLLGLLRRPARPRSGAARASA
ncbi:hypothetical protein GCM10009748_16140 [Agromyces lapidis]